MRTDANPMLGCRIAPYHISHVALKLEIVRPAERRYRGGDAGLMDVVRCNPSATHSELAKCRKRGGKRVGLIANADGRRVMPSVGLKVAPPKPRSGDLALFMTERNVNPAGIIARSPFPVGLKPVGTLVTTDHRERTLCPWIPKQPTYDHRGLDQAKLVGK